MEPAAIDWGAPLAVLAAGLGLGALLLWRARRGGVAPGPPVVVPLDVRDLAGKRDSLVQQLREFDDTTVRWTADLSRERYTLELKLARVLLALEEHARVPPKSRKTARSVRRVGGGGGAPLAPSAAHRESLLPRSAPRGFLWGAGTAAAFGFLLLLVARGVQPRAAGGSVTGDTPVDRASSRPSAPVVTDGEEARVRAALARDPADLDAHLDLARVRLAQRDLRAVWAETQYVLEHAPGNPRALSYQALVWFARGETDRALDMLNRVVAEAPDLLEAYGYLAFIYVRTGRDAESQAVVAEVTRRFPTPGAEFARRAREMRQQIAAGSSAGVGSAQARAAGGQRPASVRGVTLILELDSSLQAQVSPGSVVFVTVREAGVERGAPAAVKRLAAVAFPIIVSIDETDSMAGAALPAEMRIEARVDADGDPLTRSASEPSARVDRIKAGASGVRLVLTR